MWRYSIAADVDYRNMVFYNSLSSLVRSNDVDERFA